MDLAGGQEKGEEMSQRLSIDVKNLQQQMLVIQSVLADMNRQLEALEAELQRRRGGRPRKEANGQAVPLGG